MSLQCDIFMTLFPYRGILDFIRTYNFTNKDNIIDFKLTYHGLINAIFCISKYVGLDLL